MEGKSRNSRKRILSNENWDMTRDHSQERATKRRISEPSQNLPKESYIWTYNPDQSQYGARTDGNIIHLFGIPKDILLHLISWLKVGDLINLQSTCKLFHELCEREWKPYWITMSGLPIGTQPPEQDINYFRRESVRKWRCAEAIRSIVESPNIYPGRILKRVLPLKSFHYSKLPKGLFFKILQKCEKQTKEVSAVNHLLTKYGAEEGEKNVDEDQKIKIWKKTLQTMIHELGIEFRPSSLDAKKRRAQQNSAPCFTDAEVICVLEGHLLRRYQLYDLKIHPTWRIDQTMGTNRVPSSP